MEIARHRVTDHGLLAASRASLKPKQTLGHAVPAGASQRCECLALEHTRETLEKGNTGKIVAAASRISHLGPHHASWLEAQHTLV